MALRIDARLGNFARAMRREPTEYEKILWQRLRASQLLGLKFRRQAVIEPYICDFLCPAIGLIVEIDGDTHSIQRDHIRDTALAHQGFVILRFSNSDVRNNIEGVLETIMSSARALPERQKITHPHPSLGREGL